MKKIIIGMLLISTSLFGQANDSIQVYDSNYNKLKVLKKDQNIIFKYVDSLYNKNQVKYNMFYLIDKKDTLFIRRKETYIKLEKVERK